MRVANVRAILPKKQPKNALRQLKANNYASKSADKALWIHSTPARERTRDLRRCARALVSTFHHWAASGLRTRLECSEDCPIFAVENLPGLVSREDCASRRRAYLLRCELNSVSMSVNDVCDCIVAKCDPQNDG